jgi:hypothetical protein
MGVLERRGKPRVSEPFPTTVSGIDKAGESFDLDCVLDNISSTGLYLKMPRQLEQGSTPLPTEGLSPMTVAKGSRL